MITVETLLHTQDFHSFHAPAPEREVSGVSICDLLSWVMGKAEAGQAWVTIMSNRNVAAIAVLTEVACVILADGVRPDDALLDAARQHNVNLLGSALDAYQLACRFHDLEKQEALPSE